MVDLLLEAIDLRVHDTQRRAVGLARGGRGRKVGTEVEKIVLDPAQHGIEIGGLGHGREPRQADRRIGLVDRAIGLDPHIRLAAPLAGAERGRAVVSGARVDAIENHHGA